MATTVTKVIDPDLGSGYDYDSLYDWEAAQQGDLTGVRDEIAVAKCRCTGGTADSTAFTIAGWTLSATQYFKIWTDPAESYRHEGKWQTGNKYRMSLANSSVISLAEYYARIDGLQIAITSVSSNSCLCIKIWESDWPSAGDVRITNCILKGVTGSSYSNHEGIGCFDAANSGGASLKFYIANCVAYDFKSSQSYCCGFDFDRASGAAVVFMYNNTAHNCDYGFVNFAGGVKVINCIADDMPYQDDFYLSSGSWVTGSNYNATSETDANSGAPGANCRYEQTFSFVDPDNGDFHLQSSDTGALGYGTNLYNDGDYPFQVDIDGQDRGGSGATWHIGADQYNPIALYYRTAATPTALSAASWTAYTVPFTSLGFVQLKAQA